MRIQCSVAGNNDRESFATTTNRQREVVSLQNRQLSAPASAFFDTAEDTLGSPIPRAVSPGSSSLDLPNKSELLEKCAGTRGAS